MTQDNGTYETVRNINKGFNEAVRGMTFPPESRSYLIPGVKSLVVKKHGNAGYYVMEVASKSQLGMMMPTLASAIEYGRNRADEGGWK